MCFFFNPISIFHLLCWCDGDAASKRVHHHFINFAYSILIGFNLPPYVFFIPLCTSLSLHSINSQLFFAILYYFIVLKTFCTLNTWAYIQTYLHCSHSQHWNPLLFSPLISVIAVQLHELNAIRMIIVADFFYWFHRALKNLFIVRNGHKLF